MARIIERKAQALFAAILFGTLVGAFAPCPVAAQGSGAQLKVNVNAKCEGVDAVFEILNEGELWPAMAKISVYRADSKTLVSTRQMRMAPGQKMAYKAKGSAEGKTEFGLWIEPQWYTRPFVFDAVIACG